jgi:hypothetical protein
LDQASSSWFQDRIINLEGSRKGHKNVNSKTFGSMEFPKRLLFWIARGGFEPECLQWWAK